MQRESKHCKAVPGDFCGGVGGVLQAASLASGYSFATLPCLPGLRGLRVLAILGSPFDLVSRVSKVGSGAQKRFLGVLSRLTKSKEFPSRAWGLSPSAETFTSTFS